MPASPAGPLPAGKVNLKLGQKMIMMIKQQKGLYEDTNFTVSVLQSLKGKLHLTINCTTKYYTNKFSVQGWMKHV